MNQEQEYTQEEIEERAKENSEMYWNAREREGEPEIHRPYRSN